LRKKIAFPHAFSYVLSSNFVGFAKTAQPTLAHPVSH